MKRNALIKKEALTLFSKEALESLRKERFNGKLRVFLENGIIKDFDLNTSIRFFIGKRREDDFFMDDF